MFAHRVNGIRLDKRVGLLITALSLARLHNQTVYILKLVMNTLAFTCVAWFGI